ncbi:Flavin-dependent trigonelline monooxygenase, oxygenase component [Actinosynnema sp. ALI-1.44]
MDFSLFYFADDTEAGPPGRRYELLVKGARRADLGGLTAVWTPERHFHRFGGLYPNPAVTGAAIAMVTSEVRIRAGSVVAPLAQPVRVVEDWSVVDNLSGGRVGLSFASGWHARDFALRPDAFAGRRERVVEVLHEVRELWCGRLWETKDGTGADVRLRPYPAPVQEAPPMWLTSAGSVETFRAAGTANVGVLTYLLGQDLDELAEKIREYRRHVRRTNGNTWAGHVVVMVHTYLDEDPERAREHAREPLVAYLKSSLHLIAGSTRVGARNLDPAELDPRDVDHLVRGALDRYFEHQGLFGSPDSVLPMVDRLAAAGVDEIACLVDFGLPTEQALRGIDRIGSVSRLFHH